MATTRRPPSPRALLLHWKEAELAGLSSQLSGSGFEVEAYVPVPGEGLKGLVARNRPDLLLVCLDRLPSHGHAVADHFRKRKDARMIPIVFVGGAPDKVEKIRAAMPGCWFTGWGTAVETMQQAISGSAPPAPKVKSQQPPPRGLYEKLGLKADSEVAVLGAPADLYRLVPDLPFEVFEVDQPGPRTDVTLWFLRSMDEADDGFSWIAARMSRPRIWTFYRRGSKSGMNWGLISERAAAVGLAQYKILRFDDEWTGVAFGIARKGKA